MIRRRFAFFSLLLYLPLISVATSLQNSTHILQDVFKEISKKHDWNLEEIKVSKLEASKVRFGTSQRYEFKIRVGKNPFVFKFPDEVDSWNNKSNGFEDLGSQVSMLGTMKIQGPFDLRVGGNDKLSLSLPMNGSRSGLKRVLVGEGITVEVMRAREVSQVFNVNLRDENGSFVDKGKLGFYPIWNSICMSYLPVHIVGSASLVAYRTRFPNAAIETSYLSNGVIELLPEKCYCNYLHKVQLRPSHSLRSMVTRLENVLRSFLGDRIRRKGFSSIIRANVKASTIVRFQLEVEKTMGSNETRTLPEWRTKPVVERLWFEVMARAEGTKLKPLMVKKVRPFIAVDSASWSNLMSNISFTKFPSVLVPPEALTLDVKW